jgi:uncharacterized protein (DUF342 family)
VASGTSQDGTFELSWSDGLLLLSVSRPEGGGRPVSSAAVCHRLREMGLRNFSEGVIATIVQEATGASCPVMEYRPLPARVLVEVDSSGLEAFVTVLPPEPFGEEINQDELSRALAGEGVVFGVDEEAIRRIVEEKPYKKKARVARGQPPVEGPSGTVELLFDTHHTPILQEDKHGTVDYRETSTIENVVRDQVIARRRPPGLGAPGTTVKGDAIPAIRGREAVFKRGANTRISEDGNELFAAHDGQVVARDGVISVEPVFRVEAVDFKSGNIHFNGSVTVGGSVGDGFQVVAKGDILVAGTVGAARMESGGNIIIKGGLVGGKRAVVIAKGDFYAKFIDDATVRADGQVVASEYIMHSDVTAGRKVILKGAKGAIIGGSVRAVEEITARIVGSPRYEGTTLLEVGPLVRGGQTLQTVLLKIGEEWRRYREVRKNLRTLHASRARSGHLPPDRELLLSRFEQALVSTRARLHELVQEGKGLKARAREEIKSRVVVWDTVYPGARVQIGNESHTVVDPLRGAKFMLYRGAIQVTSPH